MDFGAIGGALANIGGDVLNYNLDRHQTDKMWRRQENSAANAHQTEVKDLEKAGLNPILSANSGASTPNYSDTAAAGFNSNSALQTAKLVADTKLVNAQAATQQVLTGIEADRKVTTGIEARRAKEADALLGKNTVDALTHRVGDKSATGQIVNTANAAAHWIHNAFQAANSAGAIKRKEAEDKRNEENIKNIPNYWPENINTSPMRGVYDYFRR